MCQVVVVRNMHTKFWWKTFLYSKVARWEADAKSGSDRPKTDTILFAKIESSR